LKIFWNKNQDNLNTEIDLDPVIAMEYIDLIRGLEKGYISRGETFSEPINFDNYVEPSTGVLKFGNGISYSTMDKSDKNFSLFDNQTSKINVANAAY